MMILLGAPTLIGCGRYTAPPCDDPRVQVMVMDIARELDLVGGQPEAIRIVNLQEVAVDDQRRLCRGQFRSPVVDEPAHFEVELDGGPRGRFEVRNAGMLPGCASERILALVLQASEGVPALLEEDREALRIREMDRDPLATRRSCGLWTDSMDQHEEPKMFTLYWENRDALQIGLRWVR